VKFWYNPHLLALFALLVLSIPALKSLTGPGFYTSHDGETHVARIAQYYQALADRQFPPRFAGSFYNGLGSPIFVYIYPLPYFLGSLLHLTGFSFVNSFKILMALGFVFSGIFAYLWLKAVFKSEKAAFLGALFYMWVPYRFLLIYVRGSISELLAYTFLPLLLFSVTKLWEENNPKWLAFSAISFSLLLLSQNLVAVISVPIIFGYVILLAINRDFIKTITNSLIVIVWGLLISAVTYLPSIFERKFVRFDEIIKTAYENHFVTLKQLIRSPWGYGFDLPGIVNDQISFQIGLTHILILFFAIFSLAYVSFKKNFSFPRIEKWLATFFLTVFILAAFLMLQIKPNTLIWQKIKYLHFIDLPWRFLGITSLSLAFLTAFAAKISKSGFLFLLFVVMVLVANRNHLRINQAVERNDSFFAAYSGTATQYDEFTPKWRQSTRVPIGFDQSTHVEAVSGNAKIENVVAKSNEVTFEAKVITDNSQVRINKFYFPGANVQVDGQKLTPFRNLTITDTGTLLLDIEQDASGLMMVNLEKGEHHVSVKFGETRLRLFANFLSFGSLVLALGVLARNVKR